MMRKPDIHRATALTIVLVAAGLLVSACALLSTTEVHRYILDTPVTEPSPGQPLTDGIFLQPFLAAEGYDTDMMVLLTNETRRIENSEHLAWQASAPNLMNDVFMHVLGRRFPNQVRSVLFPPPQYILHGKIEKMAIAGEKPCAWDHAVLEIHLEIQERTAGSFRTISSKSYAQQAMIPDGKDRGVAYSKAMSEAFGKLVAEVCDGLEVVAGKGKR